MTNVDESALDSTTGWILVALGFGMLVLVWGFIFTFTVYAGELASTFGLSQLRVSSVFSVTTGAFFIAGGSLGVVISRMPLRPVMAAAGATLAVAIGLLQVVSSYLGVVVAFALIGMSGGVLFVIVLSVLPQWFDEYEGRAMGIALTSNGIGILALPFAWLWLFERTDLRGAVLVVGVPMVAIVLVASRVYGRPPGLRTGGHSRVDIEWLRSHLTDARFLIALVGFALLWSWYFVLSASLVDILTTAGIRRAVAATAFGTIGGISVLTRLASGVLGDRLGKRVTLTVGVVLAALGVFALLGTDTGPIMYVTLVVFGIGLGAIATLFSPIVVDEFGPANATAIVGLFTIAESSTAFLTPIALNVLVELTGSYDLPLLLLGVFTIVGAVLFYWGTGGSVERP